MSLIAYICDHRMSSKVSSSLSLTPNHRQRLAVLDTCSASCEKQQHDCRIMKIYMYLYRMYITN